jgi:small-conductance mechanosensitive channel
MTPWMDKTPNQRRTLRNWAWIWFGPVVSVMLAGIIAALVFSFTGAELQRIHWLGWIGMALATLLALIIIVFGMEISLRTISLKAGKDGIALEAGDDGEQQS